MISRVHDSDDFVAEMNIPVKRKQLSLGKPVKKAALSPSKRFEKNISEEEVQKTSKGCIPENAALDGHFVPLQFAAHPLKSPIPIDARCTIQIRAPSDVTLLGIVLRFCIGMQL